MKYKTNFYGTSLHYEAGMRIKQGIISKDLIRHVSKVIFLIACFVGTALQVNAQADGDDGEYLNWTGTREVKFHYMHNYTIDAYLCVDSRYAFGGVLTVIDKSDEVPVFNMESVGNNSFRVRMPLNYYYESRQYVCYWAYNDGNIGRNETENNPNIIGCIILYETIKDSISPIKDLSIFKFRKCSNNKFNISDVYFIETQTGDTITVDPSSGRLTVTHNISDGQLMQSLFKIVETTSNEEVTYRNDIRIYVSGKELRIEASSEGVASVYNLLGGLVRNIVYSDGSISVSLPPGVYIVKAGTTVAKVIL